MTCYHSRSPFDTAQGERNMKAPFLVSSLNPNSDSIYH